MANGKLKIKAVDIDGDGEPDEYSVSLTLGKATIVGAVTVLLTALGYSVI